MQNDLTARELKNTEQVLKSVGVSEVDNIDPQTFSNMILRQTRANLVMRDVAADVDRSLVGSAGSTIDYREIGTLQANDKTEFNATADQTLSYPAVRVGVDVKQAVVPISDEAREDANLDVAGTVAEEIGVAMGRRNDQDAYNLITNESYVLDSKKYNGTETLGDNAYSEILATDGNLTFEDMAALAGQMRQNDQPVDATIISEEHAHELVQQDLFHLANQRGDQVGRMEGRIGRILRTDVYVTSQANGVSISADGSIQAVMLASDRAFVEAVKREPRVETKRKPQTGEDIIVGSMRYGHEIYDAEAIGYLKNSTV